MFQLGGHSTGARPKTQLKVNPCDSSPAIPPKNQTQGGQDHGKQRDTPTPTPSPRSETPTDNRQSKIRNKLNDMEEILQLEYFVWEP
jgi:hypothetical protein